MGDDWLIESEQCPEVIRFNSPSVAIKLQVDSYPFEALYNPVVGVNIMSYTFAKEFWRDMPLIPTNKLLKNCSGHITPSLGVLSALPIVINDFHILRNFYIFDVWDFDVMIGVPIIKLLQEGRNGKLNIKFGKGFSFSIPITHAVKVKAEPLPGLDPIEEVKTFEFDNFIQLDLEDDTQFFIDEEEEDPIDPEPLDELLEPLKPPIELKPLPSGLKYVFLNNDKKYPMIISDKLSDKETYKLITVLEKHRAAFGYSLQDLKGISPVLCTHCIPTNPEITPSREPQHRLKNTMREVVKKEVLKLLHAGIIILYRISEWVSPMQVVPKRGGMTVVQNDKNKLIPQRTVTGWRMCIGSNYR